jgi:hypothetical protein
VLQAGVLTKSVWLNFLTWEYFVYFSTVMALFLYA